LKYGNIFQKNYFQLAKGEIKVKSIISVTGVDISTIRRQHARVIHSKELSNYIKEGFQILPPEEAHEIVEKLSYRVL
jgi:hypothetical protein